MDKQPQAQVSAVVLAGGQSARLGRDKSLLEIDGQPLLARTVRKLVTLSDDLIIVTNHASRYRSLELPARFVADEQRGMGSLMGIYSGLKAARHSYALAVACDMPFLNMALLNHMICLIDDYDVIIPRFDNFLEPLHAIYSQACQPAMGQLLEQGRRQIIGFFDQVRVRYIDELEIDRFDPQRLSFVNVNTPDDWARVQSLLQDQASKNSMLSPPPGSVGTKRC